MRVNTVIKAVFFVVISFMMISPITLFSETLPVGINSRSEKKEELKKAAPGIFIDCRHCYIDYIKTKIDFVNYAWDVKEADVYIQILWETTGSGGRKGTLIFKGEAEFRGIDNKIEFYNEKDDSEDERRENLVKYLKIGLTRYISNTPLVENLDVEYNTDGEVTEPDDPWDHWIFEVYLSGYFNAEESSSARSLRTGFRADRVTEASRIMCRAHFSYSESNYEVDEETVTSIRRRNGINGNYIISINDHWSTGAFANVHSSTWDNSKLKYSLSPAIEYNLFPYSESVTKQLRCNYRIHFTVVDYFEETIYGKTSERLMAESLNIAYQVKQKWGRINFSASFHNYFHDFSKYHIDIYGGVNWRIFKGLELSVHGGYSVIHDQLSLRKGEATPEEILLHISQMETTYDYHFSIGFSYTFGATNNNIVNPRFGF